MRKIVIPESSHLYETFGQLAREAKVVILVGLPGVGKSLYVQQLSVMAQQAGRKVHFLQWDVTRSAFETPETLAKYPEIDGVTHAMIRKAVGLWTRGAIVDWAEEYSSEEHILIGEATFVGERLMQLAKIYEDSAENLLASDRTQFVLSVPTKRVRNLIEEKRAQSIANPQHEHESKDAPPNVLQMLWHEIYSVGYEVGIADKLENQPDYDADVYRKTYEYLLQHRNSISLSVDEVFEPAGSVYELGAIAGHLQATPEQVTRIMSQLEHESSVEAVQGEVKNWYKF